MIVSIVFLSLGPNVAQDENQIVNKSIQKLEKFATLKTQDTGTVKAPQCNASNGPFSPREAGHALQPQIMKTGEPREAS